MKRLPEHGHQKRLRDEARRARPQFPGVQVRGDYNRPLCDPNNDNPETRQQKRCRLREHAAVLIREKYQLSPVSGYDVSMPRRLRRQIIRDMATTAFHGGAR